MVKLLLAITLFFLNQSCGVKKPPTPLYQIPDSGITTSPTPKDHQ